MTKQEKREQRKEQKLNGSDSKDIANLNKTKMYAKTLWLT